jgi:hypothetical protein
MSKLIVEIVKIVEISDWLTFWTILSTYSTKFCWISRQPVIVRGWSIAHWNRLTRTNRMVPNSSFYDHWMPVYLAKCQKSAFLHFRYCAIWHFAEYLGNQWSYEDDLWLIRVVSPGRIEWWLIRLSTTIGCRDIPQNVKWRSIENIKMPIFDVLLNISP